MNVCIVGRFPPPLGGVSVYIKRRFARLLFKGVDVTRIDFSKRGWFFKFLLSRPDIYEANSLNLAV